MVKHPHPSMNFGVYLISKSNEELKTHLVMLLGEKMHGAFNTQYMQTLELKHQWSILRKQSSKIGIKEAAYILGVSEAELLVLNCGNGTTRLSPHWDELILKLEGSGLLKIKTQNEFAEIETVGRFEPISSESYKWKAIESSVNVHFYPENWKSGFAIESSQENGRYEYSFQFFGSNGFPATKITFLEDNGKENFKHITRKLKNDNQHPFQSVKPTLQNPTRLFWNKSDYFYLIDAWNGVKTKQDFDQLLNNLNITRVQALRLGEGEMTRRLARSEFKTMLKKLSKTRVPSTIKIVNPGAGQYFSGVIPSVIEKNALIHVSDNYSSINIDKKGVAEVWNVKQPTSKGQQTSLELYDCNGKSIIIFFNDLYYGKSNYSAWSKILSNLKSENIEYGINHLSHNLL